MRGSPTCSTMKFRLREVRRRVVDVGDVERVLVQRPDRRSLVDVDVLDAELLARLQIPVGLRILERPAARALPPLRGIELARPWTRSARRSLAAVFRPSSPSRGSQRVLGMNLPGCFSPSAALRSVVLNPSLYHSVRYVGWKIATSTWPSSKTSFMRSSSEYFWNLLERPVRLGRPEPLVRVEALDPALGVLLGARHPVVRGGVPVVHVAVDHEVLLAILLVHSASYLDPARRSKPM